MVNYVKPRAVRMPRISKTETLNLRIDPALKEAAAQAAAADRRSLTAYIEKLIEDDIRSRPDLAQIAGGPGTPKRRGAAKAKR
jgi:hypothetical protein